MVWKLPGTAMPAQLDLFAVPADWAFAVEHHDFSGTTTGTGRLNGRYAGSAHLDAATGLWSVWVSLGWVWSSMTACSSHQRFLGEFETVEAAESALETSARAARKDPTLIWSNTLTKEDIRKAKANGWWKKERVA